VALLVNPTCPGADARQGRLSQPLQQDFEAPGIRLQRLVTAMGKDRLAAFSDGVIAIIITIMVLELKVPHGSSWEVLAGVAPNFLSYVLSFVYLAIYWNNHHHLLHTVARVDGLILWANSHLLFWLSLIPAATAWMGENFLASVPTAVYGTSLLMPAIAYYLLQKAIMRRQGTHSVLANALGGDFKGKISPILYVAAIGLAFVSAWLSVAIYVLVAAMWLIPDRRIENVLREK
jgi:TMEM175 potassium channel family protein